jgi:TolB protein
LPRALAAAVAVATLSRAGATAPPLVAAGQQQPSEVELVIRSGSAGTPPRLAVPDFVATSPEAAEAARIIGQVLWDDLAFEREFYLIPRDTYATVPTARTVEQLPMAAWRELGADGLIFGVVERTGATTLRVQARLLNVTTRQSVFAKEYSGALANPRLYAHTLADEIHLQQRALKGVARTKLAFSSDRTRDRVSGAAANRDVKEIYISDYDGGNPQRITNTRQINLMPSWFPDGRALAYASYRRVESDIYISRIYEGILENPLKGVGGNYTPVPSPDGTRIAFLSNRDGNPEIYVMNRDGSGLRRLTNHPAGDATPTWSPNGAQIAFTSDRAGQPQIYVMSSADGSGLRRLTNESFADQATWAPGPFNEIAFAARTGAGYDVKILDLATNQTRQLTFGTGSNERPVYSPTGRHLAFTSTRGGRTQVFTVGRDGQNPRQVTSDGNNFSPAWSR